VLAQPARLIDMAAFYAAIANEGRRPAPYGIESQTPPYPRLRRSGGNRTHPLLSLSSRAPKAVMGNKIPVKNQMTPGQQPGKSYPDTTELAGL
jgi:hypothetical protein